MNTDIFGRVGGFKYDVYNYTSVGVTFKFGQSKNGKSYRMVIIGTQVWMAQNLNFGNMIGGDRTMRDDRVTTKYCYNDKEANCDVYGGLYQWAEAMQYSRLPGTKGICPEGWHIPSDFDWKKLEEYLGMTVAEVNETGYRGGGSYVGAKLKPRSSMWDVSDANEFPVSGFNALPAGYRYAFSTYYYIDEFGFFWSSTEASDTYIWHTYCDISFFRVLTIKI